FLTLAPFRALAPLAAITAVTTIAALAAAWTLVILLGLAVVGAGVFTRLDQLVLTLILIGIVVATLAALVFKPRAALAQDAEIMVRELKVIFCLDTVAGKLCVARHALVLFEKLRRIA